MAQSVLLAEPATVSLWVRVELICTVIQLSVETTQADPRALLEFARTKLVLANEAHRRRRHDLNRRFLSEARALLERVIQLDASPTRHAWAWRELARTLRWLRAPVAEVEAAYRRAIALLPEEQRFVQELETIGASRG